MKGKVKLVRVYILCCNNKTFSAISASAAPSTSSSSTSSIVSPSAAEASGFAGLKNLPRETLTFKRPLLVTKPYLPVRLFASTMSRITIFASLPCIESTVWTLISRPPLLRNAELLPELAARVLEDHMCLFLEQCDDAYVFTFSACMHLSAGRRTLSL